MNKNFVEKIGRILVTFAFVFSVVGVSAAPAQAYQAEENIPALAPIMQLYPDLGIISYWKFDEGGGEVAADSADGNTGTLVNNPVWTQGRVGSALEFDGASTYVQLPDSSNLKPSDALSLEFWMYPHEVGVDKHIFGSHSTCNFHPWHIGLWYSNGIVFRINDHPALYVSDVVSIPDVWYHVVATFDKNSGRKVYVNGAEVASDTYSSPTCGAADDIFRIGGRFTTPDMYAFDGILDEMAIYNRAVSAEEIEQHYQNGLDGLPYWASDTTPIANAGGPYEVTRWTPLVLNGSDSVDPEGGELMFEWTVYKTWGDYDLNQYAWDNGTDHGLGPNPNITFFESGRYQVLLRVTDEHGGESNSETSIEVYDPNVVVSPQHDHVSGQNWPDGLELTLAIDGNPINTQTTHFLYDKGGYGVEFNLSEYGIDVVPGMLVELSGSGYSASHVVRNQNIDNVDVDQDFISGTANPGSYVRVRINEPYWVEVIAYADANRHWEVDFKTLPEPLDIRGSTSINVIQQNDVGSSHTIVFWVWPILQARPQGEIVEAIGWKLGTTVVMSIDDPSTIANPDFSASKFVDDFAPWDSNETYEEFAFADLYDLKAGDIITMQNSMITKTHTVTNLNVTDMDILGNSISGNTDTALDIQVWVHPGLDGSFVTVPMPAAGAWTANFPAHDLLLGEGGPAVQYDEDGDGTWVEWHVLNPKFFVVDSRYSNCCAYNVVGGEQWEPGKTISLYIDDPSNGAGWDYQDSLVALDGQHGWANSQWTFNIDPQVFQIQPGYIVQVTDGTTVKEHVVKDLVITDIDLNSDTVEGRSNSDEQLYVPVMVNDQYAQRFVSPDINGHWIADFSQPGEQGNEQAVFDITRGTLVIPEQADEDGDSTKLWWQQPNPYFFVDFAGEHIFAFQWPVGAMVTVTIDDPETPEVDFMETQPVRTDNPWGSETWIDFQSPIPFKSGLLITMTDGNTVKTHTVTNLTVTEANSDTDTVSGTATPGALVRVWIHDPVCCIMRHVIADADGQWVADYSIPGDEDFEIETFDLQPGNSGQASQPDEDTDATNKPWQVPNPVFSVLPDENSIEGNDWPLESILTIKVGDPDNADYTTTTAVNAADLEHGQTWFKLDLANIFDLQPSQIVTVSDTKTTKQTIIVPRNITLIDLATDTITGEAEPNILNVVLWTSCVDNDCAVRIKDVNTDGSWFVNFGVPGEQPWEDDIVDIQPDTTGGIYQGDTDGDGTTYLEWSVRNQMPVANSGLDRIVYAGETITLDASASFDPEGGTLTYAWDLDNDGLYDDATGVTVQVSFSQVGEYVIGLQVTDAGGLNDTDTVVLTISPWTLKGFYQPVDMNGVYNLVKGGSTVPLKFEIFAGTTELTDPAIVGSLTYAQTACDANATTDEIELTATGNTSLRYEGGQFIYNWKTPASAGKCYRVTMTTFDGSTLMAYFKLK